MQNLMCWSPKQREQLLRQAQAIGIEPEEEQCFHHDDDSFQVPWKSSDSSYVGTQNKNGQNDKNMRTSTT